MSATPSQHLPASADAPRTGPSKLLTTGQLAELLNGVSRRTLEDWRRKGLGPDYVMLGPSTVRYRPEAVEAWLQSKERNVVP